MHKDVNKGIIEGHLNGCITSTTILSGGEAFHDAVLLAQQCPKLGVGVHLTLVGARPVAHGNIDTLLTKNGMFYTSYKDFVAAYVRGAISKRQIEYELRCQMQKVVESGIKISHIDSHQHLHALPGIADIVAKIAYEFNITKIRRPAESLQFFDVAQYTVGRVLARSVLTGCAIYSYRQYKKLGLCSPQHFFGMLSGGTMTEENLKTVITHLPDGISEIMVHPAYSNQVLSQQYHWGYHWREELEALESEEVLQAVKENAVQLINYRELLDETV